MIGLITGKQFFRYAVLPGLRPRLAELFGSGFQYIPYFMALVYRTVRLLPDHHPYLNPANMGRFGIRHVIAEAANHLVFDRRNADQIVLFVSVLVGLVIIVIQIGLLVVSLMFNPVLAAPPWGLVNYFVTPDPTQDIAHILLDLVFGVPGIFDSCISVAADCNDLSGNPITDFLNPLTAFFNTLAGEGLLGLLAPGNEAYFPFPIHTGMHRMFQFYSLGLLVVAVLITSYFIITILAETAQTGTPFGKRFNRVWAPLRFVVAFGLLVPTAFGLNSAQYIVLYAAKFGSGFATNGWNHFNAVLAGAFVDDVENLVGTPNAPEAEFAELLQFFFVARTCKEAMELATADPGTPPVRTINIRPYLVKNVLAVPNNLPVDEATPYGAMMGFAGTSNVVNMVFGIRRVPAGIADPVPADVVPEGEPDYGRYPGYVKPICGEIQINLTDPRFPAVDNLGVESLQQFYWGLVKELWYNTFNDTPLYLGGTPNYPLNYVEYYGSETPDPTVPLPGQGFKWLLRNFYLAEFECVLRGICGASWWALLTGQSAIEDQIDSALWGDMVALQAKGWAGAGIWYNRIAQLNGAVTAAVFAVPTVKRYPFVMEYVKYKKLQYDQSIFPEDIFTPLLADGQDVAFQNAEEERIAAILDKAYKFWAIDGLKTNHNEPTGNIVVDTINQLLGTDGLFSMRKNENVHPLAQLVGIGKALVESSIRNIAGVGIISLFKPVVGNAADVFSGFLVTVTMIGLTAGFILFYVVPFLPFIYFFFAVGGWIKGIFEAMLGAPLWALAHIRIDGEGLPGQAAMNGYFLIFEIFIRPILIIFGLLASVLIFSALVKVLNQTFDLVTANLAGFDVTCEAAACGPTSVAFYRAPVDEFAFTVMYAMIVYIMGMSSFKLIDQIPNNILRWMGSTVKTFNDQREDPTQGMVGTATIGAQQAISNVGGGLKGVMNLGK